MPPSRRPVHCITPHLAAAAQYSAPVQRAQRRGREQCRSAAGAFISETVAERETQRHRAIKRQRQRHRDTETQQNKERHRDTARLRDSAVSQCLSASVTVCLSVCLSRETGCPGPGGRQVHQARRGPQRLEGRHGAELRRRTGQVPHRHLHRELRVVQHREEAQQSRGGLQPRARRRVVS